VDEAVGAAVADMTVAVPGIAADSTAAVVAAADEEAVVPSDCSSGCCQRCY